MDATAADVSIRITIKIWQTKSKEWNPGQELAVLENAGAALERRRRRIWGICNTLKEHVGITRQILGQPGLDVHSYTY